MTVFGYHASHEQFASGERATLSAMFPGRLWMALGSGQRLNEAITGLPRPGNAGRQARLRECAHVMRALWAGETVTHHGRVVVEEATLYTRPERPPRRVVEAFRANGGAGEPVLAQAKVAWGPDEAATRADALAQWSTNLFEGDAPWEPRAPRQFEQAAAFARPEDLDGGVLVSSDLGRHATWLHECAAVGVDELLAHNVARNQRAFLETFGAHVLPQLR